MRVTFKSNPSKRTQPPDTKLTPSPRAMKIARDAFDRDSGIWWDRLPSGTNRVAVWQMISRLRKAGWQIVTVHGVGYRLERRAGQ